MAEIDLAKNCAISILIVQPGCEAVGELTGMSFTSTIENRESTIGKPDCRFRDDPVGLRLSITDCRLSIALVQRQRLSINACPFVTQSAAGSPFR